MGCEQGHKYIDPGNICGGCGYRAPVVGGYAFTPNPATTVKLTGLGMDREELKRLAMEYFRSYRVGYNDSSLEGLVLLLERVRDRKV